MTMLNNQMVEFLEIEGEGQTFKATQQNFGGLSPN